MGFQTAEMLKALKTWLPKTKFKTENRCKSKTAMFDIEKLSRLKFNFIKNVWYKLLHNLLLRTTNV